MSTEIKQIKGFAGGEKTGYMPEPKKITVRFTSDRYGETISVEDGEIMLGVPYEPVKKMIEKARKNK